MATGNFFILDNQSEKDKRNLRFRYIGLVRNREIPQSNSELSIIGKNKDCFPQFPVYMVIEQDEVNFYYHGYINGQGKDNSPIHSKFTLVNRPILTLTLSGNIDIKDSLTTQLKSCYNSVFTFPREIYQLNRELIGESNSPSFLGYSNVEQKQKNELRQDLSKCELLELRELLLDFIFDWEHSRLFNHSHLFDEAGIRLKENYLFKAICSKYSFLYERELYHRIWLSLKKEPTNEYFTLQLQKKALILTEAEKQWLNIIRNNQASETFAYTQWFEDLEDEYNDVLLWGEIGSSPMKKFMQTFHFYTSYPNPDSRNEVWKYAIEEFQRDEKPNPKVAFEIKNKLKQINKQTVSWFVRRYAFLNVFRATSSSSIRVFISILTILTSCLTLGLILYLFGLYPEFMKGGIYLFWLSPVMLVSLTIGLTLGTKSLISILPRFFMTIISSWLLIFTTAELWIMNFTVDIIRALIIGLVFFVIIGVFLYNEITNIDMRIRTAIRMRRVLIVLLIGLLYSINTGIVISSFNTRKMLEHSNTSIVTSAVKSEDKSLSSNFKLLNKTKINLDYIDYSDLKTYLASNHKGNIQCVVNYGKLNKTFGEDIYIVPGLFLMCSFLAVFIGLFFQLIFDEKAVTESF